MKGSVILVIYGKRKSRTPKRVQLRLQDNNIIIQKGRRQNISQVSL